MRVVSTYGVPNAPDGNTHTLGLIEAGLGDSDVVVSRRAHDVDLGEGDLANTRSSKSLCKNSSVSIKFISLHMLKRV